MAGSHQVNQHKLLFRSLPLRHLLLFLLPALSLGRLLPLGLRFVALPRANDEGTDAGSPVLLKQAKAKNKDKSKRKQKQANTKQTKQLRNKRKTNTGWSVNRHTCKAVES